MGWSWADMWSTPDSVVAEAMALMNDTVTRQAVETSQQALVLRALQSAKAQLRGGRRR